MKISNHRLESAYLQDTRPLGLLRSGKAIDLLFSERPRTLDQRSGGGRRANFRQRFCCSHSDKEQCSFGLLKKALLWDAQAPAVCAGAILRKVRVQREVPQRFISPEGGGERSSTNEQLHVFSTHDQATKNGDHCTAFTATHETKPQLVSAQRENIYGILQNISFSRSGLRQKEN